MFSFFKKSKQIHTASINNVAVEILPGETLLLGALRQGVAIPNSCRVGGCATCKCKLVSGKVKELTDSSYILSADELKQGYVLACQAVPLNDIAIQVELAQGPAMRTLAGRVTAQRKLTHDITELQLQLDAPLDYRAGQFADLSLQSLPGIARSYSFATPPSADGACTFFVRKVPDGVFSGRINDADLTGEAVELRGPCGDFWLRPANTPLLLIAGGSGLAPIMAILRELSAQPVQRPVTLLFGARTQIDLYLLDEIAALAAGWREHFEFIPVLSAEPEGSSWNGARGLVTEQLKDALHSGAHVYLCGPPPMIDSAEQQLLQLGVSKEHIHADRFTTQADNAVSR
ncbi:2Fe-2S iron-sulfur cluster-binding protein [Pseudomonas sp. N040]|uniref:2Fe-2S iron-sulfur cluster-binding protein n=1 Tax=Pseudomonas sp. N040 TaxID=2785325 RepID=UPI0018A2E56F|nr:2Fe-2S iron-sulfur cluster binding domain-containing protein [Pseudomonas sp. N040]MBF7731563.1 2Fe-2S iron-sulfur cluster binding domain-containing protein [Pseudomonas sp. N040]MBW7015207.1 2Fe-2S iron-sulfur cluster binding domain-containing protein [Pseudomonas sp. N040]